MRGDDRFHTVIELILSVRQPSWMGLTRAEALEVWSQKAFSVSISPKHNGLTFYLFLT